MKKKIPSLKFRTEIRFTWHSAIDPEDALNAEMARAKQKFASYWDAHTPEGLIRIMEDRWLASVANIPPEKWDADTWATIQERVQAEGLPFWKRLTNATVGKRRRVAEYDPVEILMLKSERKWEGCGWEKVAGLKDWNPRAVLKLMKFVFPTGHEAAKYIPNTAKTYNKKRRSIGLAPQPRGRRDYVVIDIHKRADGQLEVETKD